MKRSADFFRIHFVLYHMNVWMHIYVCMRIYTYIFHFIDLMFHFMDLVFNFIDLMFHFIHLTLYLLARPICHVLLKFRLKKRNGHKKFPMRAASMSR